MSSKRTTEVKITSQMQSETPATNLGKRKFIDSLDGFDAWARMDAGSAHTLLHLYHKNYSDNTIVGNYTTQYSTRATKEQKTALDLALKTVALFRKTPDLITKIPSSLPDKACPKKLRQIASSSLCDNLHAHFEAGKFTDFTIYCQLRSWKVHRVIICSSSEFFDTCLSRQAYQENDKSMIILDDEKPEYVNQLVAFFYSCNYELSTTHVAPSDALTFHVKMYIIGDKYGVYILKCLARQKLESVFDGLSFTREGIAAFLEAVELIYGTILAERDEQIREMFASIFREHQVALKNDDAFMALIGTGLGDGTFDRDVVKALVHR